jgi:hypothetical protein
VLTAIKKGSRSYPKSLKCLEAASGFEPENNGFAEQQLADGREGKLLAFLVY